MLLIEINRVNSWPCVLFLQNSTTMTTGLSLNFIHSKSKPDCPIKIDLPRIYVITTSVQIQDSGKACLSLSTVCKVGIFEQLAPAVLPLVEDVVVVWEVQLVLAPLVKALAPRHPAFQRSWENNTFLKQTHMQFCVYLHIYCISPKASASIFTVRFIQSDPWTRGGGATACLQQKLDVWAGRQFWGREFSCGWRGGGGDPSEYI